MSAEEARASPDQSESWRRLSYLAVAASGCAALIYEVVWFQLLGFVIGASWPSLGVLLATFMGGMALGSLALPRLLPRTQHGLRLFAYLELGIGVLGLGIVYMLPELAALYAQWGGTGAAGMALRAGVAALCLLPPTLLMGATLPIVARSTETTPRGTSWLGLVYAANVGGAVLGSLLAAFYLLRHHDVVVATFTAMALNFVAAVLGVAASYRVKPWAESTTATTLVPAPRSARIYLAIALSGMTALGAEIVWTRHLSLLFGATVYAFALILAVFLLGLGAGSSLGAILSRRISPQTALGCCQCLLCGAIAWGAYAIASSLPYWPIDVTLTAPARVVFELDFIRALWAMFPAALLWGASFPFALAAAASPKQDAGSLVGAVYAANTAGAIVGALATSFVLVPRLGSEVVQQIIILVAGGAGLLVLVPLGARRPGHKLAHAAAAVVAIVGAIALAASVRPLPNEFVAFGRFMPTRAIGARVIDVQEGLTTAVAVSEDTNGARTFHSAGKAQASTYLEDMRLQRMLGHLTTLTPDNRSSMLVIGLGAGITAGAVAVDPAVERVVVVEIEPATPRIAREYFGSTNWNVLDDPKVELRIDDGRHYLSTTSETFDGITSDPLDPWVKGAAALYTREFWNLARSRLNSGGVVTVFVQFYETTEEAVRSEMATFFEIFPNGAVFANTVQGMGYDAVLLGRADDAPIDVDRVHTRLMSAEPVARSLRNVGLLSTIDLLGTYAGNASALRQWLAGAAVNTDSNLRLQYLAGQGVNAEDADVIFESMSAAQTHELPERLFTGSPRVLDQLTQRIRARHGRH